MSVFSRVFGPPGLSRRLVVAALLLYLLQALLYVDWFIDDAAISFTYARNLGQGHGLVLFPGGERVEGYSNPLWVFLLAPFATVHLDLFVAAKVLSLLLGAGALIGVSRLGDRLSAPGARSQDGYRPGGDGVSQGPEAADAGSSTPDGTGTLPIGPLAALLTALHPPFVIWTTSGLEAALYCCLLVGATARLVAECLSGPGEGAGSASRAPGSGFLFCLAALTRPEGIMYVVMAAAVCAGWAARTGGWRAPGFLRRWTTWAALFVVPWALYQAWHFHYFAAFVTNTFFVKRPDAPVLERLLNVKSNGWGYVFNWLLEYRLWYLAPLVLLPLVDRGADSRARAWELPAGLLAAAVFFPLYSDGDWMKEFRFLAPAAPFFFLMLAGGLQTLLTRVPGTLRPAGDGRPPLAALVVGALVLVLASPAASAALEFRAHPEVGVADVRARADYFRQARETLGLTGDVVFMDPDLGATSFYSGMRVVDTWGLADVAFARHGTNQAFVPGYVFTEVRPDFLHVYGYWNTQTKILDEPRFATEFVAVPQYRGRTGALDGGNYVARRHLRASRTEYPVGQPAMQGFESGLELVYAAFDVGAVPPGGETRLTLYWRATRPYTGEAMFLTRLEGTGLPTLNLDHLPIYGWYQVSRWTAGEVLKEVLEVKVPANQPAGSYALKLQVAGAGDGRLDPVLMRTPEQPQLPVLQVGRELARSEAGRLSREAKDLLSRGQAEAAAKAARGAASIWPEGAPAGLVERCEAAWRRRSLQSVEKLMGESARQAAQTYRPVYWRWPDDPEVQQVGRRLGGVALEEAITLEHRGDIPRAFESYLAAVVLDPRLAAARQRAEALRSRRDRPSGLTNGPDDSIWVRGLVLGAGTDGALREVRSRFRVGESVVCQVYWSNTAKHRTEWVWFDPEGNRRFEQSQSTGDETGLSFAFIGLPDLPGTWTVEVRVNGSPVGSRRFTVDP